MPTPNRLKLKGATLISISAKYNTFHYGYFSDLISGVINTALFATADFRRNNIVSSPIIARFVDQENTPVDPKKTSCLNLDSNSRIFQPYFDGEIPTQVDLDQREDEIEDKNATVIVV